MSAAAPAGLLSSQPSLHFRPDRALSAMHAMPGVITSDARGVTGGRWPVRLSRQHNRAPAGHEVPPGRGRWYGERPRAHVHGPRLAPSVQMASGVPLLLLFHLLRARARATDASPRLGLPIPPRCRARTTPSLPLLRETFTSVTTSARGASSSTSPKRSPPPRLAHRQPN